MNKLFLISTLILLVSCKSRQVVVTDIKSVVRSQYESRVPKDEDMATVNLFFDTWSGRSIPIDQREFEQLDTLEQLGYRIYEGLITDTTFIGINPRMINAGYILMPNTFYIGYADNYRKEYDFIVYDTIKSVTIKNFRPRITFEEKQILYYTKEYQSILPEFARKYGVGSFLYINSYLMSNHPVYLETEPVIKGVVKILNSNEYIISFRSGNHLYETLAKRENNRWIKIMDLTILTSD
ncbi:MAG: hypothetical protein LBQ60_05020 [Bacteroidales bacterium]|jgi:hypothetical protein|nr:hypothetical protein [Bacteroidales bacterium]